MVLKAVDLEEMPNATYIISCSCNTTGRLRSTVLLQWQCLAGEQSETGSNWPRKREDWVGRITYDYDQRYFLEINGAYNGSEKFGPDYRFDFFPSVAGGWVISNESFIKDTRQNGLTS